MIMWVLSAVWNCLAAFGLLTLWQMWWEFRAPSGHLRFVDDGVVGVRLVHLRVRRRLRTVVWKTLVVPNEVYWSDTGLKLDADELGLVQGLLAEHEAEGSRKSRLREAEVLSDQAVRRTLRA